MPLWQSELQALIAGGTAMREDADMEDARAEKRFRPVSTHAAYGGNPGMFILGNVGGVAAASAASAASAAASAASAASAVSAACGSDAADLCGVVDLVCYEDFGGVDGGFATWRHETRPPPAPALVLPLDGDGEADQTVGRALGEFQVLVDAELRGPAARVAAELLVYVDEHMATIGYDQMLVLKEAVLAWGWDA